MKARIIATGSELFKQHGYEAVTVNDICKACSITKTTFYYHLSSKQDILLQLYDLVVDNLVPVLSSMIHEQSSYKQVRLLFEHLIVSFMDLGVDLNSQLLIVNLQRKERALHLRKNLEELAVSIIAEAQRKGEIHNPNSAHSLYAAAAYMFTGYEYMWCTLNGQFNWRELFFQSLDALLDVDSSVR